MCETAAQNDLVVSLETAETGTELLEVIEAYVDGQRQ